MEDEDEPLSVRQLALLTALREAEQSGQVDLRALAERAGYTESSIRTYFTKRLEGVLVFRADDGSWRVRGAIRCTGKEFARRMSQNSGATNDTLRSEEAWRSVVRKLLYEGQRRHYRLAREELELVAELTPEPEPSEPIADDLSPQPSLFRR